MTDRSGRDPASGGRRPPPAPAVPARARLSSRGSATRGCRRLRAPRTASWSSRRPNAAPHPATHRSSRAASRRPCAGGDRERGVERRCSTSRDGGQRRARRRRIRCATSRPRVAAPCCRLARSDARASGSVASATRAASSTSWPAPRGGAQRRDSRRGSPRGGRWSRRSTRPRRGESSRARSGACRRARPSAPTAPASCRRSRRRAARLRFRAPRA